MTNTVQKQMKYLLLLYTALRGIFNLLISGLETVSRTSHSAKHCKKINLIRFADHPQARELYKKFVTNPENMKYLGGSIHNQSILDAKIEELCENPHAFIVNQGRNLEPKGIVAVRQSKVQAYLSIECCFCHQIWKQKLGDLYQISYKIDPQHQGQGLATKATSELLQRAFCEWNLPSLAALIRIENYASISVARKLGFQLVGTFLYDGHLWEFHHMTQSFYLSQWFCE